MSGEVSYLIAAGAACAGWLIVLAAAVGVILYRRAAVPAEETLRPRAEENAPEDAGQVAPRAPTQPAPQAAPRPWPRFGDLPSIRPAAPQPKRNQEAAGPESAATLPATHEAPAAQGATSRPGEEPAARQEP